MNRFACVLLPALFAATPVAAQVHHRIYPAPTAPVSVEGLPAGAAISTVRTADGLALHGIEVAPRDGKPLLLVFHGNESSAMESIRWFAPLIAQGFGVVAAEYREYSGNPGEADEAGLAADADAFYARARSLAGSGKLIVVGHSLGGGVAFGLATRRHFDALVTIGAFTRLRAMVPKILRAAVPDGYDNEAAIARLDEPLYIIHGTADDVVPWQQGEQLSKAAQAAGKSGAAFTIQGAGHAPDGAVLAMILQAIAAKVENGGKAVTATLPQTVKLVPFAALPVAR